jgi:hypothetical protein
MIKKYNIIFDTNCIHTTKFKVDDLNFPIKNLINFLKENNHLDNINLYLPETVLDEKILQNIYNFENIKNKFNENLKVLNEINININSKPLDNSNYEKEIKKEYKKVLKKYGLTIIKLPKSISAKNISDRFFSRKKPFINNTGTNAEKGFKDSLIWETILNFGIKNENLIFVSKNTSDFTSELEVEFKKINKKEIIFIEDCDKTESYLDNVLGINSETEKHKKKIKNIVDKNFGELMLELHRNKSSYSLFNEVVSGYTFKNPLCFTLRPYYFYPTYRINLDDSVEVRIDVEAHYIENPDINSSFGFGSQILTSVSPNYFSNEIDSILEYDNFKHTYKKRFYAKFKINVNEDMETLEIREVKLTSNYLF